MNVISKIVSKLFFLTIIFLNTLSSVAAQQCNDGIDNDNDGFIDALVLAPNGSGGSLAVGNGDPYYLKAEYEKEANIRGIGGIGVRDVMLFDQATANIYCNWKGYQFADRLDCNSSVHGRCGFRSAIDNNLYRWNGFNFTSQSATINNTWLVNFRCVNKQTACKDGIDNDGDGRIDTQDSGCTSPDDDNERIHDPACGTNPNGNSEVEQCRDNIDNDNDGVSDRQDPGCWNNPSDPNSYDPSRNNEGAATTQCQDGVDNDNDRLIDRSDPGCWNNPLDQNSYDRTRNNEGAAGIQFQCQDGIDNDGDGVTDRADPGCWDVYYDPNSYNPQRNLEAAFTTQCQDNNDNDTDRLTDRADPGCWTNELDPNTFDRTRNNEGAAGPQCQDGRDNDSDGVSDRQDPGCWTNPNDPNSYDRYRNNEGAATTQCQDSIDNDGDRLTDRADPGCWSNPTNSNTYDRTRNNEGAAGAQQQCQDGIDNDGDGVSDRQDPGCWNNTNDPNSYDPTRNNEGAATTQCQDGVDNDGDRLIDRSDPGCWSNPLNSNTYDRTRNFEGAEGTQTQQGATNLSASDGTNKDFIVLSWNAAASPVSSYNIYRSDSSISRGNIIANVTSSFYQDATAQPGVVYYYTVQPLGGNFNPQFTNTDSGFRAELEGARLKSPIFSKFNTFLNQLNFLELAAEGSKDALVKITVYNLRGQEMISQTVSIRSKSQLDIDINSLVRNACNFSNQSSCSGFSDIDSNGIIDTYGLVKLDFDDSDIEKSIVGRISNYRPDSGQETYSFAFAKELRNPIIGRSFANANTFDPQAANFLVPNWAEIINLDTQRSRDFTFVLYDQNGSVLKLEQFTLPPLGEKDIAAGHEIVGANGKVSEGIFLGEVFSDANYLFSISRYSSNDRGAQAKSYNFAFAVEGRSGAPETLFTSITNDSIGAGCAIPTNWVEILNVRSETSSGEIIFRDGSNIVGRQNFSLTAKSQFHFNASALLPKGAVGSAEIRSNSPGSFISQSMTYLHDCSENRVQTAYSLPAKTRARKSQAGSLNTFLGMSNNVRLVGTSDFAAQASLSITPVGQAERTGSVNLGSKATSDLTSSNTSILSIGSNTYGILKVNTPTEGQALGFVIRSRSNNVNGLNKVDFVMPTELK